MTVQLTPKQEKFCQVYVETGNASEAYRSAYNTASMKSSTITVKASELLASGNITVRVGQLRERLVKKHNVTVDSLIIELEEARKMAFETAQVSAAVSATMGKAKLCGLDKQVIEQTTTHKMDLSLAERLTGGSKK